MISRIDSVTERVLFLTYDNRNRLVAIHESLNNDTTLDLSYEYDTFNRRVGRTHSLTVTVDGGEGNDEETTTTTTAEKYVYDGDHVVLDFYKPHGGSFSLERRYLHGPGIDQVLAQENIAPDGIAVSTSSANRVYWLLADNLGTVRDLLNKDGGLVDHYRYDAFGNRATGNANLTRYLYTGREFDVTTGLQYNRNRWYDSITGRWLSEDPLGFAGGDTNLYRYVGNNPTNFRDPSGLTHAQPPAGWFSGSDGAANRDVWNRTWELRVHGGEGEETCSSGGSGGGFGGGGWAGASLPGKRNSGWVAAGTLDGIPVSSQVAASNGHGSVAATHSGGLAADPNERNLATCIRAAEDQYRACLKREPEEACAAKFVADIERCLRKFPPSLPPPVVRPVPVPVPRPQPFPWYRRLLPSFPIIPIMPIWPKLKCPNGELIDIA